MAGNLIIFVIGFIISLAAFPIGPILWFFLYLYLTRDDREVYGVKNRTNYTNERIDTIKLNIEENLRKGIDIFSIKKLSGGSISTKEGSGFFYEIDPKNRVDKNGINVSYFAYVYPNAEIMGQRDPMIMSEIYDKWYPSIARKYQCSIVAETQTLTVDDNGERVQAISKDYKQNLFKISENDEEKVELDFFEKGDKSIKYVYISKNMGGKKYHSQSCCGRSNNMIKVEKKYAESHGYVPCKKCYKEEKDSFK